MSKGNTVGSLYYYADPVTTELKNEILVYARITRHLLSDRKSKDMAYCLSPDDRKKI